MRSYPILKTKYTSLPVSVDQAKKWLRLDIPDFTEEDGKIEELIQASISYVETETNLSMGLSTYEWYLDYLPCEIADRVHLESVISVEQEGDLGFTEIVNTNYSLIPTSERTKMIRWAPAFSTTSSFFKITFLAGYAEDKIPPRLLQAVRGLIAEWYDSPGDYLREKKTMVDRLLEPYILPYAG